MPDLTMCRGANCEVKETCYRYTAKASEHQSYFLLPPIPTGEACEYLIPNDIGPDYDLLITREEA